jgi:hypothetical protein
MTRSLILIIATILVCVNAYILGENGFYLNIFGLITSSGIVGGLLAFDNLS